MHKIEGLLRGSFARRLVILFLIVGVGPTLLLATIPSMYQFRSNRLAVQEMNQQLREQSERDLLQFASVNALRYDQIFSSEALMVQTLADYIGHGLANLDASGEQTPEEVSPDLWTHTSGWVIRPSRYSIGFLQSPEAVSSAEASARQQVICSRSEMLKSIVDSNSTIRTSFIITEDQKIWIYPNRFWDGHQCRCPRQTDLTTRPYYGPTESVVWTNPYRDIEPVITVAAPIWADGTFWGMAGVDFSLAYVLDEVLQTSVGENGFMFLLGPEGELVAMPDAAYGTLMPANMVDNPENLMKRSLLDVVSEEVRNDLVSARFLPQLGESKPFLVSIQLPQGPSYLAVAPMPNVPWHVAVLRPEQEASKATSVLGDQMAQTLNTLVSQSLLTGAGFLLVVLLGGWITTKRLIFPIERLTKGAEAIGGGELTHRVPTEGMDDEIRSLAATFNSMAASVQSTRDDLKRKGDQLTVALQRRDREFSTLNQIAGLTNRRGNLAEQLSKALQISLPILESEFLAISLLDTEGEINHTAFAGADMDGVRMLRGACDQLFNPLNLGHLLTGQGPISLRTESLFEIPDEANCLEAIGIDHAIMTPLRTKNRITAVLTLLRTDPEPLKPETLELLPPLSEHIAILIENAQLQRRTRDLVMMEERRRLASELHDSVTQSLFSVSLAAEGLRASMENSEPALDLLTQQVEQVQREMRALIHELRPLDDDGMDIELVLKRHLEGLQRLNQVEAEMSIHGDTRRIPDHVQRHISRIVQEALSNVSRHAQADKVWLNLEVLDSGVELQIEDNGRGFDPGTAAKSTHSLGLLSMRERAELLGGALMIRSKPGDGTQLTLRLPLEPKEDSHEQA
ncbi:MAG: ATP-binding protein [Anaerolineales bacterium]